MKMKEHSSETQDVNDVEPVTIEMFGEVLEDGQFRGNIKNFGVDEERIHNQEGLIHVGEYAMWGRSGDDIFICHVPSGEMGAFKKKDFETYVSSFFGLNF